MSISKRNAFLVTSMALGLSVTSTPLVHAETAAQYANKYGANTNYSRYESVDGVLNNAEIISSRKFDDLANEASDNSYVNVKPGGSVTFTAKSGADALSLRFSIPDGKMGKATALINNDDKKAKTFDLDSKYGWQYIDGDVAYNENANNRHARFGFDEVHGFFGNHVNKDDKITIKNDSNENLGLDFIELENVEAPRKQPENSISLEKYKIKPGDDITEKLKSAIVDAKKQKKALYIPEGYYNISEKIGIEAPEGLEITGAGIWYTQLHFTSSAKGGGGFDAGNNSSKLNINNFYLSSELISRRDDTRDKAQYKAFAGNFGGNSKLSNLWIEHFECGAWIGDYEDSKTMKYTKNLIIENNRIRNNLADGVNLVQGTKNSIVRNNNFRGNGDDSVASWATKDNDSENTENNTFEHNTIELGWRAGGIGIFGGNGHKILNNHIKDNRGGAGIRVSTVFAGYGFKDNTLGTLIKDNWIENSGTSNDFYGNPRGSLDFEKKYGDLSNIKVENTTLVNQAMQDMSKNFDLDGKVDISNTIHKNPDENNRNIIFNINQVTNKSISVNEDFSLYYYNGETTANGISTRLWLPKSANINITPEMTHSYNNDKKKVYNFANGDIPSFLPESTNFLKDYNYLGEQEYKGNVIRFWQAK